METTEKIVEAYVRYIKGWATIPNIKCGGQLEIDLLAIDPVTLNRYHIESGVSVSGPHSKLTSKPFSEKALKTRVHQAGQRRTVGYFAQRKFGSNQVVARLAEFGFEPGKYHKVVVSWGWTEGAARTAERGGITLWDFRDIVREIAQEAGHRRTYFTDDTLRTLQLFERASAAGGAGTEASRGASAATSNSAAGHEVPSERGSPQQMGRRHTLYGAIVRAIKARQLQEPFRASEVRAACPGFADNTYQVFLHKHALGNRGSASELFERVAPGRFRLIRPLR